MVSIAICSCTIRIQFEFVVVQIAKSLIKLREDLTKKGTELNEFKEKHNIRIQGQDENNSSPAGDTNTTSSGVLSK
jgi:prefoldin subunit 2